MIEINRTYFLGIDDLQTKREKLSEELAKRDYTYDPKERKMAKKIYVVDRVGKLEVGSECGGEIYVRIANHPEGMKLSRLLNVLDI
ncbi:hypothetical protein H8D91_00675 [archaeon]|nr:hypothetical protein [archaeon]